MTLAPLSGAPFKSKAKACCRRLAGERSAPPPRMSVAKHPAARGPAGIRYMPPSPPTRPVTHRPPRSLKWAYISNLPLIHPAGRPWARGRMRRTPECRYRLRRPAEAPSAPTYRPPPLTYRARPYLPKLWAVQAPSYRIGRAESGYRPWAPALRPFRGLPRRAGADPTPPDIAVIWAHGALLLRGRLDRKFDGQGACRGMGIAFLRRYAKPPTPRMWPRPRYPAAPNMYAGRVGWRWLGYPLILNR